MASNIHNDIKCPICTATLRKPIRILSCGHNFCHECLVQHCASYENEKCPTCGESIVSGSNGLEGVSRNYVLENLIEEKMKANVSSPRRRPSKQGKPTLNQKAVKQLKELSKSYQQQNNYQKAVETLQLVLDQVDGWEKFQPTLDLVEYLIELGQLAEAVDVCEDIISIADSIQVKMSAKQSKNVFDDSFKLLILKLIKQKEFQCATKLTKCLFNLVKKFLDKKERFYKLTTAAWLVAEIAKEKSNRNNEEQIKKTLWLLEDVVDYMQKAKDVDLKFKCEQIAWVLMHFGFCCNKANVWMKSIIANSEAINLIKTVFGENSTLHHIVGLCQNNLGNAYLNTKQLEEAKTAYMKAIETYNTATDWESEGQKTSCVSQAINNFESVEKHLPET